MKNYKIDTYFSKHMETNKQFRPKIFQCSTCNKAFADNWKLQDHIGKSDF